MSGRPGRGASRQRSSLSSSSTPTSSRPKAAARSTPQQELGARAEAAVAAHLAAHGLEILGINVRVGRLEIDVIARDGEVIVIVEVRTRGPGSYVRALDSIDAPKRARVRRAGERLWRERFSRMPGVERMRFDVAAVAFLPGGEAIVEHVRAAF